MIDVAEKVKRAAKRVKRKKRPRACDTGVLTWFHKNTLHNSQFEDIDRLLELKKKQGVKISVGIPTLNEEENVGKVIATLRDELFKKHHLIDEIAIIDSAIEGET